MNAVHRLTILPTSRDTLEGHLPVPGSQRRCVSSIAAWLTLYTNRVVYGQMGGQRGPKALEAIRSLTGNINNIINITASGLKVAYILIGP